MVKDWIPTEKPPKVIVSSDNPRKMSEPAQYSALHAYPTAAQYTNAPPWPSRYIFVGGRCFISSFMEKDASNIPTFTAENTNANFQAGKPRELAKAG